MGSWHKPYSLLPYLYFTDVAADERVLVVTDEPQRCRVDASGVPIRLTIFCPGGCEKNLQPASGIECYQGEWSTLAHLGKEVAVVLWESEKTPDAPTWRIMQELFPEARNYILIQERRSLLSNLKNLFRYRSGNFSNNLIFKGLPDASDWRLRWFMVLFPHRQKPRAFLLPGSPGKLPSESRFALKRWFDARGGLYLLPHHTAHLISRSRVPDHVRHVICKLVHCGESERDVVQFIQQVYISTTNVLMVRIQVKNINYFIRYPFHVLSLERIQNNQRLIRLLHENGFTDVPRPVDEQAEGDFPYFVEMGIDAFSVERRFARLSPSEAVDYVEKAMERISQIHRHFGSVFTMDEETFDRYVGLRFRKIREGLTEKEVIERAESYLKAQFLGKKFMRSTCHGDYKIGNCLFDENGELLGIIDWDMGSLDDLTLVDLASLIAKALRQRNNFDFKLLLSNPNMDGGIFHQTYLGYFALTETEPLPLFPAMLFYWIDRVYKQFTFSPDGKEQWAQQHVLPVMEVLRSILK